MPTTSQSSFSAAKRQSGKLAAYLPIIIVALLALVFGLQVQHKNANTPEELPDFERVILLPTPRALSAFSLLDENGDEFNNESVKDQWNLLFFGFTHCPDICPTTMLALKNVRQRLEAQGKWPDLRVVMVSVDPDRDAPERLKPYVNYFHPEFKGVTGDESAITAFAKELGILFIKNEADADGYYDVDHGVSMILINPQGNYAGVITAPHVESTLETDLALLAEHLDIEAAISDQESNDQGLIQSHADSETGGVDLTSDITISNAWVRAAPPNSPSLSAYLVIENGSAQTLTIHGASSPLFGNIMIHATVIEDGVASMDHLDELSVSAGDKLSFAPMGTHIMLMGGIRELKLNDQIPITLDTNVGDMSFIAIVSEQTPQ